MTTLKVAVIILLTLLLSSRSWSSPLSRVRRIVNGEISADGAWQHTVVYAGRSKEGIWSECTGTMISSKYILSAAHCFFIIKKLPQKNIYVYSMRLEDQTVIIMNGVNDIEKGTRVPVLKTYIHPSYHAIAAANDLAIVEFDSSKYGSNLPAPVKLASNYHGTSSIKVKAIGYGDYNPDENNPYKLEETSVLREVDVDIFPYEECYESWDFVQNNVHMCVGYTTKGIAKGDSGGPIMAKDVNGEWRQVGVSSFGSMKQSLPRPGVASKMIAFCKWVNLVTEGTVSCDEYYFPASTSSASTLSTTIGIWLALLVSTMYLQLL